MAVKATVKATDDRENAAVDYVANIRAARASASAEFVRDGNAWYPGMAAIMNAHADATGLTVAQCAAIYAANSINTPWQRNIALASGALSDYAAGIAPFANGGTLGMIIRKCHAVIAATDDSALDNILSADKRNYKVKNFRRNLAGDYDAVTVDRWAVRVATNWADCEFRGSAPCARDKKSGRLTGHGHGCAYVPVGAEYLAMADAYRTVAAEFGETPAATQAITWCVVRGTGE